MTQRDQAGTPSGSHDLRASVRSVLTGSHRASGVGASRFSLDSIRLAGDPVLRRVTRPVLDFGERTHRLETRLLRVLRDQPDGAGLAANQVGIDARAFAFDLRLRGESSCGVVFNPTIEEEDGNAVYDEGCLSIPGFSWPVERSRSVAVTGQDHEGVDIHFDLTGFAARLFLHEVDHLDGKLMFDRIADPVERERARQGAWRTMGNVLHR